MILSCSNISKSFGSKEILKNVSFGIEKNEKVAIVGVNGAGKSSLFRIITGEIAKDSGNIVYPGNALLGYMSQTLALNNEKTIYAELLTVFNHLIEIELELEKLNTHMETLIGNELDKAIKLYTNLTEDFEKKGGYLYKSKIRGVIKGLGFSNLEFDTRISVLSGGQKTRVSMAKLLLTNPDILLLDEPTNHLDISAINWLEGFLRDYKGAIIIISHDRYFINKIVTKVIEIENGIATTYNGSFTFYIEQKEINREIALKQFLDQQKKIKAQEESIKLLRSFNREKSVKRAESKEKALSKMDKVTSPEKLPTKIKLDLSPKATSGKEVLKVMHISKSFNNHTLFNGLSFDLQKGDKVALIGPNGVGKTTLLKIILNTIPIETGEVKIGASVTMAYYDQEHTNLNNDNTIFDELQSSYPDLSNNEIRNILATFVFKDEDVFKKIGTLSGGEKGRVALAKILVSGSNFLILDEPTNHLDIYTKDILEKALQEYTGTLLYISHDRYFINNTANKIIELSKNGITSYLGNYDYYLEKKETINKEEISTVQTPSNNKDEWKKKKEDEANIRKLKNRVATLELQIEEAEKEVHELNETLALKEVYTNHEKAAPVYEKKETTETLLLKLYKEWEDILSNT